MPEPPPAPSCHMEHVAAATRNVELVAGNPDKGADRGRGGGTAGAMGARGLAITVRWEGPSNDNGAPVLEYALEHDAGDGFISAYRGGFFLPFFERGGGGAGGFS